jgi:hypothetical protein
MPNVHAAEQAAGPVVEKFARGGGRWLGYFGVLMGLLIAGSAATDGPSHWRTSGFGIAIALTSWVVLIRPEASLREHGVFFRNILRDVFIPSSKVEAAHVSQTLMVRAEAITYHSPAVTRSARAQLREKHGGRASVLGMFGGLGGSNAQPPTAAEYRYGEDVRTSTSYESYVVAQILRASRDAGPDDQEVVVSWSWPAAAAAIVSGLAVVALFV